MAGFRVFAGLGRNCTKGLGGCFPEESISTMTRTECSIKFQNLFQDALRAPRGVLFSPIARFAQEKIVWG